MLHQCYIVLLISFKKDNLLEISSGGNTDPLNIYRITEPPDIVDWRRTPYERLP